MGYITGVIDTKNTYNIKTENPEINEEDSIFDIKDKHPTIMKDAVFDVSCTCGNYVAFKKWDEVSERHMKCGLCGNYLIYYTDVGGL